jgi:hypothetical protein
MADFFNRISQKLPVVHIQLMAGSHTQYRPADGKSAPYSKLLSVNKKKTRALPSSPHLLTDSYIYSALTR